MALSATVLQRSILFLYKGIWEEGWQQAFELVLMIGIPVMIINIAGSVTFLWILGFLEKDRLELENERVESIKDQFELQALRAQTQPHFLNNVLDSIQFLIYDKDFDSASIYIKKLAVFYKKTREYCECEFISLAHEIEQVERYIDLQKLRFEDDLVYEIQTDVNPYQYRLPPMSLFTFVENSFQHAFKDPPFQINIHIREIDCDLILKVSDNGIGIPDNKLTELTKNSVESSSITGSGVNLFNLRKSLELAFKTKVKLVDIRSGNNSGTTATITLPKRGAKHGND